MLGHDKKDDTAGKSIHKRSIHSWIFIYSRTSMYRTSMIRISRCVEVFLKSRVPALIFLYNYPCMNRTSMIRIIQCIEVFARSQLICLCAFTCVCFEVRTRGANLPSQPRRSHVCGSTARHRLSDFNCLTIGHLSPVIN